MNTDIKHAFLVLSNAIDAYDIGATINDEDVVLWNNIQTAKAELKKQIEAQP